MSAKHFMQFSATFASAACLAALGTLTPEGRGIGDVMAAYSWQDAEGRVLQPLAIPRAPETANWTLPHLQIHDHTVCRAAPVFRMRCCVQWARPLCLLAATPSAPQCTPHPLAVFSVEPPQSAPSLSFLYILSSPSFHLWYFLSCHVTPCTTQSFFWFLDVLSLARHAPFSNPLRPPPSPFRATCHCRWPDHRVRVGRIAKWYSP